MMQAGREIKFRIWDKDMKKMRICGTDTHDSMYFDQDGNASYYNLQNGCGSLPDGSGTYDLMQFTGLRDKNGREIYEGDIMQDSDDCYNIVEWSSECGAWLVRTVMADGSQGYTEHLADYNGVWKVIGNIYENPELLEGGASE